MIFREVIISVTSLIFSKRALASWDGIHIISPIWLNFDVLWARSDGLLPCCYHAVAMLLNRAIELALLSELEAISIVCIKSLLH